MKTRRYSRQQELIYQYLSQTRQHPTAEMVYQALRDELPGLSLGTVYRNLNRFCEDGRAKRLPFTVERYDQVTTPHAHFCCERCGQVTDLMEGGLESLQNEVHRRYGHQVKNYEVIFYGICLDCQRKPAT